MRSVRRRIKTGFEPTYGTNRTITARRFLAGIAPGNGLRCRLLSIIHVNKKRDCYDNHADQRGRKYRTRPEEIQTQVRKDGSHQRAPRTPILHQTVGEKPGAKTESYLRTGLAAGRRVIFPASEVNRRGVPLRWEHLVCFPELKAMGCPEKTFSVRNLRKMTIFRG